MRCSRTVGSRGAEADLVRDGSNTRDSNFQRKPVCHCLDEASLHHVEPDGIVVPLSVVGPVELVDRAVAQHFLGNGGLPISRVFGIHRIESPSASVCGFGISIDDKFGTRVVTSLGREGLGGRQLESKLVY